MRSTFIENHILRGTDAYLLARICGNSVATIMQTYERIDIRRRTKELLILNSVQRKVIQKQLVCLMNKSKFNWKKTILISFLLLSFSSKTNAKLPTTIIQSCYDGDTCTTIDGEKIRLACIDTPELKGKKADPIPATKARDFLNKLLTNEGVAIKRITKDRYGRTIAELFKNDTNVQELIVDKGYGTIYKRYANQCEWNQ